MKLFLFSKITSGLCICLKIRFLSHVLIKRNFLSIPGIIIIERIFFSMPLIIFICRCSNCVTLNYVVSLQIVLFAIVAAVSAGYSAGYSVSHSHSSF